MFGFTHIFEAYKPPARRKHGDYICPLLADGRLIGRADFARRDTALTIQHASLEPDAGPEPPPTSPRRATRSLRPPARPTSNSVITRGTPHGSSPAEGHR
ncbi:hypothetical protein ACFU98_45450 [Streptomyces sp. NPDC057575]|uniref:hypothetical protein n=1 Tax=Streptomyces sp. NPDC057575 TaxID=3346170 RepID=UPI003687B215